MSNSLRPHGLYAAHQAPLSMGFSRQEHWSRLPFPSPGGSSWPRNRTRVSCFIGGFFTVWATREIYASNLIKTNTSWISPTLPLHSRRRGTSVLLESSSFSERGTRWTSAVSASCCGVDAPHKADFQVGTCSPQAAEIPQPSGAGSGSLQPWRYIYKPWA